MADLTMKSFKYYSVSTRRSLGSNQTKVVDLLRGNTKKERRRYLPSIRNHLWSGNLLDQPRVIRCRPIGPHGNDRMQWIENELEHLWLHRSFSGNVSYRFSKLYSLPGLSNASRSIFLLVFVTCRARNSIVHASFVWGSGIRIASRFRLLSQSTIMERFTLYLRAVFLLSTTLASYRMCNCASTTADMKGLSANYIRFTAIIVGGDSALHLD